ncbi:S-layer homology domain-containing protein [Anaerovorax odorimutans]|uniref:S-layer homology domain-containing protein n=1 Tax=Anaerovorax odorimutans TaxID=109327 RepID=UPI0003F840F3|nr:S-layer homology domain-containing protein [Anaerovorax odorimutans]
MIKKKLLSTVLAVSLVFASGAVAFADIDYNQWNSQAAYPQDVVNTELFTPVKKLIDKKIITGYPDGTFKPEKLVTRAQIAVALTKMTNREKDAETAKNKNKFTDLNTASYDWARGSVNVLSDKGIIKGTTETTYSPDKNISYAELITLLIRSKNSDVSQIENMGSWPDNYIKYANMYNLMGDVYVTDWSAPATRGDMAKLMYRFMPKSSTTDKDKEDEK